VIFRTQISKRFYHEPYCLYVYNLNTSVVSAECCWWGL